MKRVISVLLTLVLVLSLSVNAVSAAAVKYGDINSDGRINNRDLGALQQYLAEWDVAVDTVAADVNDDGRVNNRDLGRLQQYLAEWDVQLGPDEPEAPAVELPAVGYDLDGKGRILVDAVSLEDNAMVVTLGNASKKWMSEETAYVTYICTDAEGNVLSLPSAYYGTLYFGMLEVGESITKRVELPEGTAKVEFGEAYIIYWTQWS